MYDSYDYKRIAKEEFYETEMQRHKDFALEAISRIAHFEKESVLRVLAYSYIEEHEAAKTLARKLNLGRIEFLAVIDDFDGFKELFVKEQERYLEQEIALNF